MSALFFHDDDDDLNKAAETASKHAGDSGDSDLFGSILNRLSQKKPELDKDDVDEQAAIKNHKKYFDDNEDDDDEDVNDRNMGNAAALQALKLFTGHGGGSASGSAAGVTGAKQSEFLGLALSEASKLFDKQSAQGKVSASATKESAIMQAGEMALKMYMKGKADAPAAGPGGGASGLLGMASKFMK